MTHFKLLGEPEGNHKSTKSSKIFGNIYNFIMYLAPAKTSGFNLCPHAGDCAKTCLFLSGNGQVFSHVNEARIRKARQFKLDPVFFFKDLRQDLNRVLEICKKENKKAVIRLNGTSDIAFEKYGIFQEYPEIQFYDYTKDPRRALAFARG